MLLSPVLPSYSTLFIRLLLASLSRLEPFRYESITAISALSPEARHKGCDHVINANNCKNTTAILNMLNKWQKLYIHYLNKYISPGKYVLSYFLHIRKAKAQNWSKLPKMQTKAIRWISRPIFRMSGHIFTLWFTGQNCQGSGRPGWVHLQHVRIFQNLHINSLWTHFLLPYKGR